MLGTGVMKRGTPVRTYDNSFVAEVGGLPLQELNNLELDFLKRLNFKLSVSDIELYETLMAITSRQEQPQGRQRPCSFRVLRAYVQPAWVN
ncbi:cyclin [Klebsormidium nitens]|uniref:Cyclin n=1 Tax=Klebsormidium nitens TaxID=105231 RepID=A0A1Y1ISY0_KLENI|nr:cyclin [Klebsormidium nitens]|eukprot:GAQ91767.1 cyclin [Klebsormidium nitens]